MARSVEIDQRGAVEVDLTRGGNCPLKTLIKMSIELNDIVVLNMHDETHRGAIWRYIHELGENDKMGQQLRARMIEIWDR
jgi:hypothetical protein